jgi:hypothetical protein
VSRLSRQSARNYRRLTPEQRRAVDVLRYDDPDAAGRGEQKTTLGWRRTAEETAAYARKLIAGGMMPGPAAVRLGVEADYLRRLLEKVPDLENPARNASIHAEKSGLTDKGKGVGRPRAQDRGQDHVDRHRDHGDHQHASVYGGDQFDYDFEAALRRASPR